MRVLLTGAGGQLGREFVRAAPAGADLIALRRDEFDVRDRVAIEATVKKVAPDVVVNAAAYTAVDSAESDAETALAVNAAAVEKLAACTAARGARLVHLSTDFVFDGRSPTPYAPDEVPRPVSVYGRSKLAGERRALEFSPTASVVRTSWLYSALGRNFVTNMLRLMAERDGLRVVTDQIGSPTWALPLAQALWRIAERDDMAGVWHWSDGGQCSWYDFACAIQGEASDRGLLADRIPIRPVTTAEFPTAAQRPAMSALDDSATRAALGIEALPWRVALGRMLDEMTERGTDG